MDKKKKKKLYRGGHTVILRHIPEPKISKEQREPMKMTSPESDKVTPAKTGGPSLVIKSKKKKGIKYRKGGVSKMNLGDARSETNRKRDLLIKKKNEKLGLDIENKLLEGELKIREKIKKIGKKKAK